MVKDIKKGDKFSFENIRSIRPGYGLHPKQYKEVFGKTTNRNLKKGTPVSWKIISD